ncbi:hypothetical protein Ancab_031065 [Ancistrocladus abbreviatus]
MVITVLVLGLLFSSLDTTAAIGTCLGLNANNLPSYQQMVAQYKQYNIQNLRTYNYLGGLCQPLAGSNIGVMVGVANPDLPGIAQSQDTANAWVQNNIINCPNVNFKYIAVGNEIRPTNNNGAAQYSQYVGPALWNIHNALNQRGLGNQIKVSTAWEMGMLSNSNPPSAGQLDPQLSSYYTPIIQFLQQTNSPLLLNCYPYFSYKYSDQISLPYALFTSPGTVVQDGQYGYQNLFDAMMDAFYSALEKVGAGSINIVVSESGWPTAGDKGTSIDNARTCNNNLIQHVKKGTPKRPGNIETYIFDMYDENLKSPALEQNWGLFYSNGAPKYPVNFN